MKFILTLSIAVLAHVSFAANTSDSLKVCFSKLQATDATVQTLQRKNDALKLEVTSLNSIIAAQSNEIGSLKSVIVRTNNSVAALADSLNKL